MGTNNGYIRVVKMPTFDEDNPDYHYMKWMDATFKLMKKLKGRRLAKEEVLNILCFFTKYLEALLNNNLPIFLYKTK